MAPVIPRRMAAEIHGDFVVFWIGTRINKPWKVHKWVPVLLAMYRMMRELWTDPAPGFLGYQPAGLSIMQWWRSFDDLERYARSADREHHPAWVAFNEKNAGDRGDVAVWHETYLVRAGEYETFYSGAPPRGLGRVGRLLPASEGRRSARERLRRSVRQGTATTTIRADRLSCDFAQTATRNQPRACRLVRLRAEGDPDGAARRHRRRLRAEPSGPQPADPPGLRLPSTTRPRSTTAVGWARTAGSERGSSG